MEDTGAGTSLTITNKATISGSIIGQGHGSTASPRFINSCIVPNNVERLKERVETNVFPNPVKDILYLTNYEKISLVQIININGLLIKSYENINEINISDIQPSVYFVYIYYGNNIDVKKIIKL